MNRIKKFFFILLIKVIVRSSIDSRNSKILELIRGDLMRELGHQNIEKGLLSMYDIPSLKFLLFFRLASSEPKSIIRRRIHAFSFLFHKRYFYKFGFQIPVNTSIGRGFQILHFGTVIINPEARLGENCTIFPGVVIGQDKRGGCPVLGNNVWIGANSVLVGKLVIGDNVLVAPGSYLNKDVPSNSLVIGNPARVFIKTAEIIEGYLNNRV